MNNNNNNNYYNNNNSMNQGNSKIQVVLRKRPLLQKEIEKGNGAEVVEVVNRQQINLLDPDEINQRYNLHYNVNKNRFKETHFTFDNVFDENSNNFQIYQEVGEQYLNDILEGFNTTIFAYGATGAGKTYTMVGSKDMPGLMNMMLDGLFQKVKQKEVTHDVTIRIAYMEIYNENLKDLISSDQKNLELREDPKSDVTLIHGLTEVEVTDPQSIANILRVGAKNRSKDSTISNEASSRSHAILQISIESADRAEGLEKEIIVSKLSLVDLAGSERAWSNKSKVSKLEGAKINQSLLTLGNCIQALSEQSEKGPSKNNFIPYRGSKLTRLLKDSLGGNCRTVMIANISGSIISFEDTYNTLQYASRAKNIQVHVHKNVIQSSNHVSNYAAIIEKLNRENENLRNILNSENGRFPPINGNSPMHMNNQIDPQLSQQLEQLEQLVKVHFDEEQGCFRTIQEGQMKQEKIYKMNLRLQQELQKGSANNQQAQHFREQLQINNQGMQNISQSIQEMTQRFRSLQEGRKMIIQKVKGAQLPQKMMVYLQNLIAVNEAAISNLEKELTYKQNEDKIREKELEIAELSDQLQLRDRILIQQKNVLEQNEIAPHYSKFANIKDTNIIISSISPNSNQNLNHNNGGGYGNNYNNLNLSMQSIDQDSIPSMTKINNNNNNRYSNPRQSADRVGRPVAKNILSIQDIQNLVKPKSKGKKRFIPSARVQSQVNLSSKNHTNFTNSPSGSNSSHKRPLYPYLNAKKQRIQNMQGDPLHSHTPQYQKQKKNMQSSMMEEQSTANISYSDTNLSPNSKNPYQSYNYQNYLANKYTNHIYSIQNLETLDNSQRKSTNNTPSIKNKGGINKTQSQRNMPTFQQRKNIVEYDVHQSPYVKSFKNAEEAAASRKNKLMQLNLNLDHLKELYIKRQNNQ
ncbi:hypothetical protein ABPG74_021849 [Tetrahymena malaccensis]